jgi:CheY-like chemotaxis protein
MEPTRILLVEDNPVNQKVAELMLRRVGHPVAIAANGKIATRMVENGDFKLVLMDANMPVMDGMAATRWIRDHIPSERQPKIIVMTASLLEEAKDDWKAIDIDGYMEKPVTLAVLSEAVQNALASPRGSRSAMP